VTLAEAREKASTYRAEVAAGRNPMKLRDRAASTIHKSKGLEFGTVVVLGVEEQTFWGNADTERRAFFVACSRAKERLFLTTCSTRTRPEGAGNWSVNRVPHAEFLAYTGSEPEEPPLTLF
jgi:superfamily I DNA/RNA helicase